MDIKVFWESSIYHLHMVVILAEHIRLFDFVLHRMSCLIDRLSGRDHDLDAGYAYSALSRYSDLLACYIQLIHVMTELSRLLCCQ